jgi:hypothetical protein
VGTSVIITGLNLTGATGVTLNGTTMTFGALSATSILAVVPAGATTGNIVVTTAGGASNGLLFTVIVTATPTVTGLSPTSGPAGTVVTITGTNLTGATGVTLNGVTVPFTVVNGTTITFTVPAGGNSGNVVVTTPGGSTTGVPFVVTIPPTLTNLSRITGPVGTAITLSGTGFTTATTVTFNGTAATFTVLNDTRITTTVPNGATTGNVVVTSPNGSSNGLLFTVTGLATTNANASEFSVWPNPVAGKGALHITLATSNATNTSLTLHNVLGQVMTTRTFNGAATEVSTANLAAGVYLLTVQQADHLPTVRRVVVE